jgi:hypothetical protein
MTLQATITQATETFLSTVLAGIRQATLEEIQEIPSAIKGAVSAVASVRNVAAAKMGVRLKRRSPEQIQETLGKVLGLLLTKGAMRSEDIRRELGLLPSELPRVLKEGIKTKQLKAKGQKRATTYSARVS